MAILQTYRIQKSNFQLVFWSCFAFKNIATSLKQNVFASQKCLVKNTDEESVLLQFTPGSLFLPLLCVLLCSWSLRHPELLKKNLLKAEFVITILGVMIFWLL